MSETKDKELLVACERGGTEDIRRLIKEGASVNCTGGISERLPLHNAAKKGHTSVISILISHGAELEAKDKYKWTPLHYAARYGHTSAISLLITHGAELEAKNSYDDTPLHLAADGGHTSAISLLISHGAQLEVKDCLGSTPLHFAALYGHTSAILLLITHGSHKEAKNIKGDTPLHKAALCGHTSAISILISNGAQTEEKDINGRTPLHCAALREEPSAITCLISHGAETEAKDNDGRTPLHYAAFKGEPSVISCLISHGAETEAKDNDGQTPYDIAKDTRKHECCDLLEAAQKFPREFQYLSVQDESTFHQTLKSGIYSSHVGKLMCVGPEGVGKTAIVSVLRDVEPSKIRVSTEGIDLHTYKAAINREEKKWIPSELNAMDVLIRDLALEGKEDSLGNDAESQNPEPDNLRDEDDNETSAVGIEEHPNNDKDVNALASNDHEKNKDTDKSKQKPMKPQFQREETKRSISIKELLEMVKRKTMKGLLERALAPVNMMDFGGQAAFYSTHQSFLTYRGLYILVIDGSKGFDDVIDTEDFLPGRHGKPTSREFTYFWVNSIQAYSKGESENFPKILVVCTHRDKVPIDEADQRAEKIFLEIEKMFYDTPAEKHLILNHRIFLNAMDPKDPGYNTLKEVLVEQICSQPSWGEKLPKAWIPLKMMINQKLEEGEMIMSVDMLREINRHNPVKKLSERELATFLKIQHAQGEIIHFPIKGLQEHIIISPAFLVDALKSLVTDKRFCQGRRESALKSMNQSGVLNREDIECIWKEEKRFFEHKQYLLSLVEHLDIIASPRQYGKDGNLQETDIYYVPSLVQGVNDTNYLELDFKSRSIGLSLKFESKILPPATGYRFIASCIQVYEIRRYNDRDMLFSGMVVLAVNRMTDLLILQRSDRIDIFLVHKTSKDQITRSTATSTLDCLNDILVNILESFRILSSDGTLARTAHFHSEFICYNVASPCYEIPSACNDASRNNFKCEHGHCITLEDKDKWSVDMKERQKEPIVTSGTKVTNESTTTDVLIDDPTVKPTERQLATLSAQLTEEEIHLLSYKLGLKNSEINEIEVDTAGNLMNKKFLCLRKWKQKSNGSVQDLKSAAADQKISLEKINEMNREQPMPGNITLEYRITDKLLDSVAKEVMHESLRFAVYLGLNASFWVGLKEDRYRIVDINKEVLQKWRNNNSGVNLTKHLAQALFNVGINIDIILSEM